MAKIIKDTKQVQDYDEDPRCGGQYSIKTVYIYSCGKCKKELTSFPSYFCPHCGEPLKGVQDEVKKRQKKSSRPYKKAYDVVWDFRETLKEGSLEYKYVSQLLKEIYDDMQCAEKIN